MPGQRRALELLYSDQDSVLVITALGRLSYFVSDLELPRAGTRTGPHPVSYHQQLRAAPVAADLALEAGRLTIREPLVSKMRVAKSSS